MTPAAICEMRESADTILRFIAGRSVEDDLADAMLRAAVAAQLIAADKGS